MAFYIKIRKSDEIESSVIYSFESDYDRCGTLRFSKMTGEVSLIEPMPGDERNQCFNRASVKIMREWKAGKLPDFLEWAS
ncbi:hypothetical protein [Xanthomonas arboricola]|uniref:hypothetical protein n=1 Tax=Xanthomonas arboricola TaxID=56448 RepID=UPI0012D2E34F|nr:hypothetical protein [Xanthomonas arboricola]